jgi:hypothetical protein
MAIDLTELELELSKMSSRSKLFAIVKTEMVKRGHWKNKSRGKAFYKGFDPNRDMRGLHKH